MKKIRLRAGLEYVKCCELAELIAYALWPDDGTDDESWEINHGTCRMHSEARIKQAAQSGSLPLKHPSSFESLEWTSGQAWKLGLVTINDLRAYVADRGITVVVSDAPEQADTKPQPTPEPTPVVQLPVKHGPGWTLKPSLERSPGYRWPLYQILKAAHIAGQPCPKPREVLEIWKLHPPPDVQVMPDGVKYNDGLGNPKEANLRAIGKAIKYLLHS